MHGRVGFIGETYVPDVDQALRVATHEEVGVKCQAHCCYFLSVLQSSLLFVLGCLIEGIAINILIVAGEIDIGLYRVYGEMIYRRCGLDHFECAPCRDVIYPEGLILRGGERTVRCCLAEGNLGDLGRVVPKLN